MHAGRSLRMYVKALGDGGVGAMRLTGLPIYCLELSVRSGSSPASLPDTVLCFIFVGSPPSKSSPSMTRTIPSDVKRRVEHNAEQEIILPSTTLKIELARPYPKLTMSLFNARLDEYDVNFADTRDHAVVRWEEIAKAASSTLTSPADRQAVLESRDCESILADINERSGEATFNPSMRRILIGITPLPRSLNNLVSSFVVVLAPHKIDTNILWGLLFLNIKLSVVDSEKLTWTSNLLTKLRRIIERFSHCYRICTEKQESTLAIIDFFDHALSILCESARYLRRPSRNNDESDSWLQLKDRIAIHQKELEEIIKYLNEITTYSQATLQQQVHNLTYRHGIVPEPEERASFPLLMLPFSNNKNFYGRSEELAKMDQYLRWKGTSSLRTFSIYGRRGVGKTEIALEYAYRNPSRFDAIFWIGCETTLALRKSFTDMALKLQIPGAENKGHDEENLLNVKKWLKVTNKRWLMIFDNADKDSEAILTGYWPIGANGAILITSRTYYNFMRDSNRKGETIKPFSDEESWDLLVRLMGDKWTDALTSGQLKQPDVDAAKSWVQKLGGLPLSIQTAASLMTNVKLTSGFHIAASYARFREIEQALPPRYKADRTQMIRNLDALFDMTFKTLGKHARDLLGVLALLSPDEILIELFLPRRQTALNGKLSFAKQESPHYVNTTTMEATLTSIVNITPALSSAFEELRAANLIRWDHRIIAIHRVVQEAMNYYSINDLQESFNSAVHLVYEAFPKQVQGNTLYEEWPICAAYISHAVHLSKKFQEYNGPNATAQLKSSGEFVELLTNASWYLYEMSDYDLSRKVIEIGKLICENKESHTFSNLCNTQGCNYYDLNRVADCRRNWEAALTIREKLRVEPKFGDIAISLHNLGNLESATGHYDEALTYFRRAVDIRLAIGDSAALQLGTTYLGIGRCHAYYRNFSESRRFYGQSEQLFVRTVGADKYFMANCHYAYGNLEYDEKQYNLSRRSFEFCLSIASAELPTHPITAAAYYSLGCVEFEMGNFDPALGFLNKARNIAELRSPARDDGTIARILWKTAMVIKAQPQGTSLRDQKEAEQLLSRAYIARAALISSDEAGEGEAIERLETADGEESEDSKDIEEEKFDLLVPGYFR